MKKNILIILFLGFTVFSFGQVPSYVPTNGLVGWWGFNGNANDESGNGNNGTVNGATLIADRFGNPNSAYDFDGVDDYISGAANSSLDVSTTQTLSMSCWIKVLNFPPYNGTQTGLSRIFSLSNAEGTLVDQQYALAINSDAQIYWLAHGPSGFENNGGNISLSILSVSTWEHIIMTYDGNSINFYLNGLLVFSKQESDSFLAANNSFFNITSLTNLPASNFNGTIDDIGIWNRALNECEIQDLYIAQLNSPSVDLGADQSLCVGSNVVLDAGAGYNYYSWSNGETSQTISVSDAGEYTATVGDSTPVVNEYSLNFDGLDDNVLVESTPDYDNMDDFSILFWAKVTNGLSRQEYISKDVDPQPNGDWSCFIENNKLNFEIRQGNNPTINVNSNTIITDDEWHFISITRDITNGEINIYINSINEGLVTGTTTTVNNTQDIRFGQHAVVNTLNLLGSMDDISIWNTVLSQAEIQNYMTCPPTGNEAGLVGYWNFEEGTGTTATDLTSNGNDGAINGSTWSTDTPEQVCLGCTASDTIAISVINPTMTRLIRIFVLGIVLF